MSGIELVLFGKMWSDLGWSVQDQVREIMDGYGEDSNPNSVDLALSRLNSFRGNDGVLEIIEALEAWKAGEK